MAELGFWDDPSGPWDRLQIGEYHMPGVWSVECTCERELETKKSKGKDGARVLDHGYTPATVTLKGTIWDDAQWKQMQLILPKLHPRKKGAERHALRVEHPALAVMGVSVVYVQKINAPVIGGKGECEFSIDCIEDTTPKVVKKKKAAAQTGPKWSTEQGDICEDAGAFKESLEAKGHFAEAFDIHYGPAEIAAFRGEKLEDPHKAGVPLAIDTTSKVVPISAAEDYAVANQSLAEAPEAPI